MFNYLISVEFEHISNVSSTVEIQLVFNYWICHEVDNYNKIQKIEKIYIITETHLQEK